MRKLSEVPSKARNLFAVCVQCKEIFIDDLHNSSHPACPNGCEWRGVPNILYRATTLERAEAYIKGSVSGPDWKAQAAEFERLNGRAPL